MNRTDVAQLVRDSAARFGDRNPQQLRQLKDRLSKAASIEVARGLLDVFASGESPPQGSPAQELAGALLAVTEPVAPNELQTYIRAVLPRYELSVEQLPLFLARAVGTKRVLETLEHIELEKLSEGERKASETMRFWLRGLRSSSGANEA